MSTRYVTVGWRVDLFYQLNRGGLISPLSAMDKLCALDRLFCSSSSFNDYIYRYYGFRAQDAADAFCSRCVAHCDFSRWISTRAIRMSRRNRERTYTNTVSRAWESHSRKGLMQLLRGDVTARSYCIMHHSYEIPLLKLISIQILEYILSKIFSLDKNIPNKAHCIHVCSTLIVNLISN